MSDERYRHTPHDHGSLGLVLLPLRRVSKGHTEGVAEMIQVRTYTYRGKDGYCISGRTSGDSRRVSIFTESRSSADHIARKVRAGEDINLSDFDERET